MATFQEWMKPLRQPTVQIEYADGYRPDVIIHDEVTEWLLEESRKQNEKGANKMTKIMNDAHLKFCERCVDATKSGDAFSCHVCEFTEHMISPTQYESRDFKNIIEIVKHNLKEKGANEMNQYKDNNGVTVYGNKPVEVVKVEKKRAGKAEKLLKHLSESEIEFVKANPSILDQLGKQANNPLYKRASKEMARTKAEQLVKAAEKYPEPLNPDSWTGEQLADHAFQEVFDLTSYITGMKIKFEKQSQTNNSMADQIDALRYALEYREKAHEATIRQAQGWKKEYEDLGINFESIWEKNRKFEKDFNTLEGSYEDLYEEHEGYKNRIHAYINEIGVLNNKVKQAEETALELEKYKTDWMTSSYDADMFRQQRDRLQEMYDDIEKRYKESAQTIDDLVQQKNTLLSANTRLADKVKELDGKVKGKELLERKNEKLKSEIGSLEEQCTELLEKNEKLEKEYNLLKNGHDCEEHQIIEWEDGRPIKIKCDECKLVLWREGK
jgi:hypothetical protein